jgi:hypothetical protein
MPDDAGAGGACWRCWRLAGLAAPATRGLCRELTPLLPPRPLLQPSSPPPARAPARATAARSSWCWPTWPSRSRSTSRWAPRPPRWGAADADEDVVGWLAILAEAAVGRVESAAVAAGSGPMPSQGGARHAAHRHLASAPPASCTASIRRAAGAACAREPLHWSTRPQGRRVGVQSSRNAAECAARRSSPPGDSRCCALADSIALGSPVGAFTSWVLPSKAHPPQPAPLHAPHSCRCCWCGSALP